MKTKTTYICEGCDEEHTTEKDALICEEQCRINSLIEDKGYHSPFEDLTPVHFKHVMLVLTKYFDRSDAKK